VNDELQVYGGSSCGLFKILPKISPGGTDTVSHDGHCHSTKLRTKLQCDENMRLLHDRIILEFKEA
jgi:hypothetical protein